MLAVVSVGEDEGRGRRPARVAFFGGALLHTQYGFVERHLMTKIASGKPGNLGTDVWRDYVYTERDRVQRFTEDFLDGVTSAGAEKAGSNDAGG